LHSLNFYEAVDALNTIPDITGDNSMEVVAGGREGKLVCYSGGIDTWTSIPQSAATGNGLTIEASPNPFAEFVNITVESNIDGDVEINIITPGGLPVRNFGSKSLNEGPIHITWDGNSVSGAPVNPGLYFVVITSGQYQKTIKLIKQ